MPSCKIPMAQQFRAQGNAARSLWVWLQEALKTEYPSPAECEDKTALWKSIPEACQYLWARPGMYSCNLVGPFCTQHENPHIRRCPICLERTNNFLARGCCRKTSGGGYSITKTARNYQTENEEREPVAFQMQRLMFASGHLAALFAKGRGTQVT